MIHHAEDPILILKELNSSTKGLKTEQVEAQRAKFGKNILSSKKKKPFIFLILEQFKEPMTIILLVAAIFGFLSTGLG
jgi:magnesium-transporting ATPase (P-type)